MTAPPPGGSYAAAGVDVAAGDRAVELLRTSLARTRRPEVIGDVGGFAGLFELDTTRYRRPVLATSTDGVGTKLALARALDRHDTVGIDLVAMVVDDIVVCGAEPLFMTDYIACGRVVPDRIATIVGGIADGCRQAGCALVGGEIAEHPGVMPPDEYDLAGAAVGVVEKDDLLGPHRVRPGDAVLAMAASGLHANGYSLVRHLLASGAAGALDAVVPDLGPGTLGDVLLTPTTIYTPACLALTRAVDVHAFAHVTGGGLAANLARVLPPDLDVRLDRGSWRPPPVFDYLQRAGGIPAEDMAATFNLGVGMLAVLAAADVDRAVEVLAESGVQGWPAGTATAGSGTVALAGSHPA